MTDEQIEKRAEELYRIAFFGTRPWPPASKSRAEVWRDAARAELEKEKS